MAQTDRATTLKRVTMLLGIVALVLSAVMAMHSLRGTALVGCAAGSSCDSVLGSRWSSLMGVIPVAGLAAGVYLAILLCLFFVRDKEIAPLAWKMLLVFGGAILGSAIWFFILQKWILGQFCKYCLATHSVGIIVTGLLWYQAHRSCPSKWNPVCGAAGLLLAAGLAIFQLTTTPKVAYDRGDSANALPVLKADETPVLGSEDAAYRINLMFDYQCSHCRKIHFAAKDITESRPDIAFVLVPCPLSYACNPYIPASGRDQFAGSCDLARLALAVWFAEPDKFAEFDEWLFTAEDPAKGWYPRTVEAATFKAAQLLGGEQQLFEAERNAAVNTVFTKSFELFGRTTMQGKSGIPRLVYQSQWIIPEVDDADGLMEILSKEFNIQ
ncbi:MAG: hypothetical protein J6T58_04230 [Bacteroidales bacterium]|nr:hypothetical protein [Bacteroidales bacterium]